MKIKEFKKELKSRYDCPEKFNLLSEFIAAILIGIEIYGFCILL